MTRGVLLEGCFKFLDGGREGRRVFRMGGVGLVESGVGVQGKVVQEWEVFASVFYVRDDRGSADVKVEHVTIC